MTPADRVRGLELAAEPWPYGTLDDFLPADAFAELVTALPRLTWSRPPGFHRKASDLPDSVKGFCLDPGLVDAFRDRFALPPVKIRLEVAWTGRAGLKPHCDRHDKLLSAQVYVSGDPKGTLMFDRAGNLAGEMAWADNRLACWTRPAGNEKHAAPGSSGRFVLLYWFMRG